MYLSEEQLEEAAAASARGATPKRLLNTYTAAIADQHPDLSEKQLRLKVNTQLRSVRKGDSQYAPTKYDPIYERVEHELRSEYNALYRAARNAVMEFLEVEAGNLETELETIIKAQETADTSELDYAQLTALRIKVADRYLEICRELGQFSGALRFDLDRLKEVS